MIRIFSKAKDGGPNSPVDAYFLFEIKSLLSIALLKFNEGGREEYHTHAFHALTWFISGDLVEQDIKGSLYVYTKSWVPKITLREKNHRVRALRDSWCFTIRGPWLDYWTENHKGRTTVFTHGRKIIND